MSGFADRADTGYPASYRVYDYAPQRIRARIDACCVEWIQVGGRLLRASARDAV
ncbi:hypothetical protein ABIB75_006524 [Bradyrhizobium sp. GM2.2]|jgi:hypothetical protein